MLKEKYILANGYSIHKDRVDEGVYNVCELADFIGRVHVSLEGDTYVFSNFDLFPCKMNIVNSLVTSILKEVKEAKIAVRLHNSKATEFFDNLK